jgi:hypothetical protein
MEDQRALSAPCRAAEGEPHALLVRDLDVIFGERGASDIAHELLAALVLAGGHPHRSVHLEARAGAPVDPAQQARGLSRRRQPTAVIDALLGFVTGVAVPREPRRGPSLPLVREVDEGSRGGSAVVVEHGRLVARRRRGPTRADADRRTESW